DRGCGQDALCGVGHVVAAGNHLFWRTFYHQHSAVGVVDQCRGGPAGVVERQHRDAVHTGDAWPVVPQCRVKLVGTDTTDRRIDVGGQQPRTQYGFRVLARRVDGVEERDPSFGQRAGLIGDQDVDVTQILNAHQPLDQYLEPG